MAFWQSSPDGLRCIQSTELQAIVVLVLASLVLHHGVEEVLSFHEAYLAKL